MTNVQQKCEVCGAILDEEDLFCANCGTAAGNVTPATASAGTLVATHNFACNGCGASMSYDASAQTLRCPFCGSEKMEPQQDVKVLSPSRVVPFVISQGDAQARLRQWLADKFWSPSDLAQTAVVTGMTAVYVPYWVFGAETFTYWTADTSQVPSGASASWYPLTGENRGSYHSLLVGASSVLTPAETNDLSPFDLSAGVPPDRVDLNNVVYEQFRVQKKYARPLAQQGLEQLEARACQKYVPGNCRNMRVNVRVENLVADTVLLPVWIMAYRYNQEVFRFLVNGQTGKGMGTAPTSLLKIALAVGAGVLAALLIVGILGLILGRQ